MDFVFNLTQKSKVLDIKEMPIVLPTVFMESV